MTISEELDQQLLDNLSFRKWSTLASFIVLIWEHAITLSDEFRCIWRRPFNGVKSAYIFSRYFAVLVQTGNLYLVFGPLDTQEPVCKQWFLFLIISACFLLAALDFILMLRVYALYRKDKRVAAFLVVLFFVQIAVDCILCPRGIFQVPYDPICDTTKTHPDVVYYFIWIWVVHISLGVLTIAKCHLVKIGAPVVRLVTRDGALTTISICSLYAVVISYALFSQVSQAHVVFNWPISCLSILCCRIIMNMQTFDVSRNEGNEGSSISGLSTLNFEVEFDNARVDPRAQDPVHTPT
ncbi:hypothetical protein M413DRAFT_449484 [Hebeloma cylindrosporum]|uniref:DUF6533 domain-containing protein n=1 Tax=Hebeloma cylindrosporum TaxID=76867 RepID=A0A0C3BV48_HEBCY|nr:hypothetical protein M413DRAFT_449484 [Hebeloma cylindrosporum h7]